MRKLKKVTDQSGRVINPRIMGNLIPGGFIGSAIPEFSWQIQGDAFGIMQSAYQIKVATSVELLNKSPDLWDSGKVMSDSQLFIKYQGKILKSRMHAFFQIDAWDGQGHSLLPTPVEEFELGLLNNSDWQADWIYYKGNNPDFPAPVPYFRKEFQLKLGIKKARLYIAARGLFKASFNGVEISGDRLVPGWTDFKQQIQYLAYDVGALMQPGKNAVGVILGDGWYTGYISGRERNRYGKHPELLFQLEAEYDNGKKFLLKSDNSWQCSTGPILHSDLYDGEFYDARLEMPGWNTAMFDAAKWQSAETGENAEQSPALVLKCCPPVRKIMEIKPIKVHKVRQDTYIWDLGQNIAGWAKIRIKGHRGRLFTIHFAEMLNQDQTLYNLNYRSAIVTDYYVTKGPLESEEVYEPYFTFHGFRYIQVDGFQFAGATIDDIEVTGVVVHSDLESSSYFHCGNELLNQLYRNICWGQRGNFLEIPSDCPQRDERLGWTGDAEVFIETACLNFNVDAFFRKWLRDLREGCRQDGAVPRIAPDVLGGNYGAAAWADAMVICPWTIYWRYGDSTILEENFEAMKKWVLYQKTTSNQLIRPETAYGDWLALDKVTTPSTLIGTAYFALTARQTALAAKVLKRHDDAREFDKLADAVTSAFRSEFIGMDGRLKVKSQTACVLALAFDLLEIDQIKSNTNVLIDLIRDNKNCLATGFVGTAWLLKALSSGGRTDIAYQLLLQKKYPSWLFSVLQGATTIWERWNSYTKKSGFGDVNMNSFNHYAYGAVGAWIFSVSGGIDYSQAGGKIIRFAAVPHRRLRHAEFTLQTPFGIAKSEWKIIKNSVLWFISAPPGTQIELHIPSCAKNFKLNHSPVTEKSIKLSNGNYTCNYEIKGR